jgi:hypothetical protein
MQPTPDLLLASCASLDSVRTRFLIETIVDGASRVRPDVVAASLSDPF